MPLLKIYSACACFVSCCKLYPTCTTGMIFANSKIRLTPPDLRSEGQKDWPILTLATNLSRSIQQIVRRATKQTGVHDICSTPQRVAFYKSNQYLIKTQGHRLTRQWIFFFSVGLFIEDDTFNFPETCLCYWRKGACRIYAPFLKVALLQKPCIFFFFPLARPCTEGCLVLRVFCMFH